MRAFACPECRGYLSFESSRCKDCGTDVGLHLPTASMLALDGGEVSVGGHGWLRCTQAQPLGCNWLVPIEQELGARGRCLADSLIRREPDADDTLAREKLTPTAIALRRLVFQLAEQGLPVDPHWRRPGGLAFDLLSSFTAGEKVLIGHAGGVITIDLVESLDAYRESLRVRLGEPYRTMLGHFRHEAGHYYQNILVETGPGAGQYLERCRELFGDERVDYSEALARHYRFGAPPDWQASFISEYATMHPWEDFAECFAHYLHITDTLHTSGEAGMMLHGELMRFAGPREVTPRASYANSTITELLDDWKWVSLLFNRVNTAMGKSPLYPFEITRPVAVKLGFVHQVVTGTRSDLTP